MFRIHRSERADALVSALVDVVSGPLDDPFTPEVVAVPTRGVERWLTHRIAAHVGTTEGRSDGVCANVHFPFPGRLVGDVLATATGVAPDEDPWRPERLVWPLLDVIDDCIGESWLQLLAAHLGHGGDGADEIRQARRFATARHVADLFDTYGVYRPDLVLSWVESGTTGPFLDIPDDATWQPRLWLELRQRVATQSPPERMEQACAALTAGAVDVDLPTRVSLFGLTRLPASYLDVLRALASSRDVHLFALHPSLALWDKVAATPRRAMPLNRADDPTSGIADNPLLRTWATDAREMQLVLSAAADALESHHPVGDGEPTTLLRRIQADIGSDVAPPGEPLADQPDQRMRLPVTDRSVQIHSCHGQARQVEVARDAICHALADDPTLEPRDVIVLCPDIDEFAPLLHATFGSNTPDGDPAAPPPVDRGVPHLPYRLADRSLRQTNPLLSSLDALLELIDGRLTAPDVLAFAARDPVRHRFGFDDDDLERLAEWTRSSEIRWALDAPHREKYWLGDVDANTWRAGLDRLLLGVAISADGSRLLGGRFPLDDVESGDIDLAGRFAEMVDRIATVVDDAAVAGPLSDWTAVLHGAVDLLMHTHPAETWQRGQVDAVLRDVKDEATKEGNTAGANLSLAEVRSLLADRLRGVPTRADFRTGAITMCTLVPMRAVPHRVVCVLGLDDGAFPRSGRADGDDLLRRMPRVGDRDPRTEDRQLLLDALLAATDRLIITTTGADVRTNEDRPAAVPVSELIDVIDRTAVTEGGVGGGEAVVRHHPLQAFDASAHEGSEPWAFDLVGLRGARALKDDRRAVSPFVTAPLPVTPALDGIVPLDDLTRFVQHPVREFLRRRLGTNVWEDDDSLDDAIPVELDALETWRIGQRLLERLLAGDPVDVAVAAELASGALPPGAMGRQTITEVQATATRIHEVARQLEISSATTSMEIDVRVDLPTGGRVSVVGTVPGIRDDASCRVSYSSIGHRHRLAAWIDLLALSATHPAIPWRAVLVGRNKKAGRSIGLGPIEGSADERRTTAVALLGDILALRGRGMCEPLPLPCKTSGTWAEARAAGREPERSAVRDWESNHRFPGEDADRSHQLVYGRVLRFDELLAFEPTEHEQGDGWASDESTRLGRLARKLWDPLLAVEHR